MKKLTALAMAALVTVSVSSTALAGSYPDVKIDELKALLASGKVTLLDVNGTESWQKGHIPGAIDFAAEQEKLATVLPKDKDAVIVAYCGGPRCNAYQAAAKAAEKLGYKNIKHLSAGISGWQAAGEKTERGT